MRLKLLLVSLLMISGILHAQDTIKTLVITEAKISEARFNYIEFTNMGATTLNLVDFEFGAISPWNDPYLPGSSEFIMIGDYLKTYLPGKDTLLAPGESFWISVAYDFNREMAVTKPEDFDPIDRIEQWNADIVFHMYEAPSGPTDSISKNHQVMERWNGRDTWYVRYHLSNGDSAVIDQVGGVFDSPEGRNYDKAYDVAGITNATQSHTLVRKFTVKEGNLNFAEARGLDLADSEWIPIPGLKNFSGWIPDRKMFWTVGNHDNYTVNETSVSSSTLDVDLVNKVIDVPWGVHNKDSVMMQLNYHPGLAWHYQLAPVHEDSAFISARTGDTLLIYACGNELDLVKFHINLLPPTDDANWVVPKAALDDEGWFGDWHGPVFDVTEGVPGIDTILDVPFATRIDTIFKYFEKAPEAEWEIVFADGNTERPDVIDGDLLRVTAKSGGVKDYFIDVEKYAPSHNAYLSSITWPDIPSYYKNVYGYIGDTVPNFQFNSYNYRAIVPSDVNGIPSLVAKSEALNTKVEVDRAVNLFGTTADKTVTFTTTAEDDTTIRVYKVVLEKERTSDQVQPWIGEPFVSQFVWQEQWANGMLEICNPGTEPLDLSNYMVMFQYTNNPVEIITWNAGVDEWMNRYVKYIPGTKWVDSTTWKVTPAIAIQDLSINPIVLPGDVFVLGSIRTRSQSGWYTNDNWWVDKQIDIDFKANPWGEPTGDAWGTQWINASWFMFKILNDSVRNGLKPADDPEDFEVIETWASAENQANWVIGGVDGNADNQTVSWVRKPQYYKGQTELEAS
ncbi:MAG: cadherin-like beta sandwich domain-containing protein [Bacteroidales bacterium]